WTSFFRRLGESTDEAAKLWDDPAPFRDWALRWEERLGREDVAKEDRREAMRLANPAFIPRNHRVEEMIAAAVERDDFAPFERMLGVLARPYDDASGAEDLAEPPAPGGRPYVTFCGT